MNELLRELESCGCCLFTYANDLLTIVTGKSRSGIERNVAKCMERVIRWGRSVGLVMSESKTVCLLLKPILSDRREVNVCVNAMKSKYVKCVKYVGISMSEIWYGTAPG